MRLGAADHGDPGDEQPIGGRRRPGDRPAQLRGVRHPQQQVEPAAGAHEDGAEGRVLHPGVVGQDAGGEDDGHDRRDDRTAGQGQRRAEQQPQAAQPGGRPDGNPPGGQGAARPLGAVDLEVEHVVEGRARGVEHHRRRDQRQPAPRLGQRAADEQPARQAVRRGGQDVRQPDQLQVGRESSAWPRGSPVDSTRNGRSIRSPRDRSIPGRRCDQRDCSTSSAVRAAPSGSSR